MYLKSGQIFFVAAMMLLGSNHASGQERSPEQLKVLSSDALKLAQSGKMDEAIDIWLEILHEVPEKARADIHANLAVAYKMSGRPAASWYHINHYLDDTGGADEAAKKERDGLVAGLKKEHEEIHFQCDQDGSAIYLEYVAAEVDGTQPAGKGAAFACPMTWWFKAGKHKGLVSKTGFQSDIIDFDAVAGQTTRKIHVALKAEQPTTGTLVIVGKGRAIQVFIDGSLEGTVPFKRNLKPGSYDLMVGPPGKMPWKKTVTIVAGQVVEEKPPIANPVEIPEVVVKKDPQGDLSNKKVSGQDSSKAGPIVLLASGGALLVTGAILTGVGAGKNSDLHDRYPTDVDDYEVFLANKASYKKDYDAEVKPMKLAAVAMYSVGGAAVVGGIVWMVTGKGKKGESKVTLVPDVSPGATGALMSVRW